MATLKALAVVPRVHTGLHMAKFQDDDEFCVLENHPLEFFCLYFPPLARRFFCHFFFRQLAALFFVHSSTTGIQGPTPVFETCHPRSSSQLMPNVN